MFLPTFSFVRWWAIVLKEFLQLRRDRITFGMVLGIPIIQIVLFGYAINTDPKHLPTAVVMADHSEFTRGFVAAMKTSGYFALVDAFPDEAAARAALARGDVQFVVTFPVDFTRRLLRGEHPAMLIEADATDPAATGAALASVRELAAVVARRDLTGPLAPLAATPAPFEVRVHKRYNPEGLTPLQHRARADGGDPDVDDGDDDRAGDDARARARHDGEPARDAGARHWR
jgi:ABC-2 type transport system permease protein